MMVRNFAPRNRHVESVFVQQELQASGAEVCSAGAHRDDDHRSFLSLKFIYGADSDTWRKPIPEFSHLQIVRGDMQDIFGLQATDRVAILIGVLAFQQLLGDLGDSVHLRFASLRISEMLQFVAAFVRSHAAREIQGKADPSMTQMATP